MPFFYSGELPASKSILNRLLTIQSYSTLLTVQGESQCEDVLAMKRALPKILAAKGERADCGSAGTTFRFLALRASRIPGRHFLTGSPQLLSRPQSELCRLIAQLGVDCRLEKEALIIQGNGWKKPDRQLEVDRSLSSQFLSALLLNSWELDFDLFLSASGQDGAILSQGYLDMTLQLLCDAGMTIHSSSDQIKILAGSRVHDARLVAEPDLSSAFALAALAALGGEAELTNYPKKSLQPDSVFPEILAEMGVAVSYNTGSLYIKGGNPLKAISADLGNSPDLFPVLAVLCAFANGTSILHGAPHLIHKESSRIASTANLLQQMGCKISEQQDGMKITGGIQKNTTCFEFNPQHDHRLVMAATVARTGGANLQIQNHDAVNKSFPEFLSIVSQCQK